MIKSSKLAGFDRIFLGLAFAAIGALSGCAFIQEATKYHPAEPAAQQALQYTVRVSGLNSDEKASGKTYYLASALKNTPDSDLQFKEYAAYLERALEIRGLKRSPDPAGADLLVFFAYGIGDPQTVQYSYAVPTWGQTGISGAYSFGRSTVFTPSYGVTGYVPMTQTETYFFRYARIDCYDYAAFRKDGKEHPLWRTDIKSTGSFGDLRRVMPALIAAALPYYGVNTGEEVSVDIEGSDPVVARIKGPKAAESPAIYNEIEVVDPSHMPRSQVEGVITGAAMGTHLRIVSLSNAIWSGKLRKFSGGTLVIDDDQGGGLALDLADIKSIAVVK